MLAIEALVRQAPTWRRVLRWVVAVDTAVAASVGFALRDPEALALAGVLLVSLLLLRLRTGLLGVVLVLLVTVDTAAFMLLAAASNVAHREQVLDFLVPASLAVISLSAAGAAVASLVRRNRPESGPAPGRVVAAAAVAAFALAVGSGFVERAQRPVASLPGDLVLGMQRTAFELETLTAPAGSISIHLTNRDLFWHTFTIDALDVDVSLPTGAERRTTFEARPGRYEFYCRVPGHTLAGMKGTLIAR